MSLRTRISDAFKAARGRRVARQDTQNVISVNALCSAYENVFAQVRPLVDRMCRAEVFGVGRNGSKVSINRTPELLVLEYPNDDMGRLEFLDAMFVTWLTESELDVRVYMDGRRNVYGYAILPPNARYRIGDEVRFRYLSSNGEMIDLGVDEVATLRFSRSPRDISKGVSPASSVEVWSQIDDLMAQYQKAYLENGAVPATITKIVARDREGFEKKRRALERGLKGAKNRNKTIYVWEQYLDDGSTADEIEVKTIQGNNSTLAIKEIIDIVNDRLNKAVGVSNFILGDDSSVKYDNAEISVRTFMKERVVPALEKFWGQFEHELNRITGGIGYKISFEIEIPELTDQLKVKAETSEKNADNLIKLLDAGAMPTASVEALELGSEWLAVANAIYARSLSARNAADAVKSQPDKTHTTKFLLAEGDTGCKCHRHTADAEVFYSPVFAEGEVDAQHIYEELMKVAREIAREEEVEVEEVIRVIDQILNGQADAGANAGAGVISEQVASNVRGEIETALENDGYHLSEEFYAAMDKRVEAIVSKYAEDSRDKMREIISAENEKGRSAEEIARELRKILPESMSKRAAMIARNETVHAFRAGRLENDKYLANKYGLKINKVWRTSGDGQVCPLCEAMEGKVVDIYEEFPDAVTEDEDGNTTAYHWQSLYNEEGETPNLHVNCRCYFDEEVV